jgi:Delta7-sterol 5-desaturase
MIDVAVVWLKMFAFDAGRYLLVCPPMLLVFFVWRRSRFRHRWIQRAAPRKLAHELRWSLSTAVVFALVGTLFFLGIRAGFFRVYERIEERGWLYLAVSVVVLIVLQDAYFYFTHRAMHHRLLFARFHRVHHVSTSPSPLAAYSFAPGEALVHALFVPLVALIVPVHQVALFLFLAYMIVRNAVGHLGIELLPEGFARSRLFGWFTTTTHHDLHHTRSRANFGLYFTVWDRVMGTTHPDYVATFERVAGARVETELE